MVSKHLLALKLKTRPKTAINFAIRAYIIFLKIGTLLLFSQQNQSQNSIALGGEISEDVKNQSRGWPSRFQEKCPKLKSYPKELENYNLALAMF